METKENKVTIENAGVVVEETKETANVAQVDDFSAKCRKLVVAGGKKINNLHIKNVTIEDKDDYNDGNATRVTFTLKEQIPGFVLDRETMEYKEGIGNLIYTSNWSLGGMIKEYEDIAWMGNLIINNPKCINTILNGATIEVIQMMYAAGEEITNPFGSSDNVKVYNHDVVINYVTKIKLGRSGQRYADMIALAQAGITL